MPSRVPKARKVSQRKAGNSVVKTIKAVQRSQPVHQKFLSDLCHAIEEHDKASRRKSSKYYKPSSMTCMRQMYYQRTGAQRDDRKQGYEYIGMADTGSRRHEAIQEVLLEMKKMGFPWKYWDIEEFLKQHRWPNNQCKNLKVVRKDGAETLLRDEVLHVSFRTDGVLEDLSDTTGDPFYLFEFKNQTSIQAAGKTSVDEKHYSQIDTYGMELLLNKALVLYENRDRCTLFLPELYMIPDTAKESRTALLMEAEGYVERAIPPPKPPITKGLCTFCDYKDQCFKDK